MKKSKYFTCNASLYSPFHNFILLFSVLYTEKRQGLRNELCSMAKIYFIVWFHQVYVVEGTVAPGFESVKQER